MTTKRVTLRVFQKADNQNVYQLCTEKFIKTYEMHMQIGNLADADDFIQWHLSNAASPRQTHYLYAITLRETGEFLGMGGYSFVDETELGVVMELEYYLLEAHWGKGYMTEALREIIASAFARNHAAKLFAQCHTDNPSSENVMKKCGMVLSAIQPKPKDYRGVIKENVRYEITADKYVLET